MKEEEEKQGSVDRDSSFNIHTSSFQSRRDLAEKNLLEASSPFVFSTVNERTILRFLKLIDCDNGQIGTYANRGCGRGGSR